MKLSQKLSLWTALASFHPKASTTTLKKHGENISTSECSEIIPNHNPGQNVTGKITLPGKKTFSSPLTGS